MSRDARAPARSSAALLRPSFERLEIGAENLDRQRALETGLGLVHRIFGRLRVVEDDAGKRRRASAGWRRSAAALVRIDPRQAGSSYGLRPTKYSSLKNPIGSVPSSARPSSLATVVTCGKLSSRLAHLRPELRRLVERNRVGHRRAHPQRAFVEVRHELRADERHQQQRRARRQRRRPPRVAARWRRQTSSSRS